MVRLRKHTFRPFRLSQAVVRKHIESLSNMNQADARCIPEEVPFLVSQEISTGRDDRIRTCDPHTPSVMRYQAALRPDRRAPNRAMIAPMQGLNRIGARVSSHVLIILPLPPCLC